MPPVSKFGCVPPNKRSITEHVIMQDAQMKNETEYGDIVAGTESPIWIRTAAVGDVDKLCSYFATLSHDSRYNRFMGAVTNFSKVAFDCLMQVRRAECFTLVAEWREQGCDAIIGEASYAFDSTRRGGEFAISVADRWQRQGLGWALLSAVQLRAISLGYFDLFGETLKTNEEMQSLARKAGFAFSRSLDWRAVRLDKRLAGRTG
jgi:RimJ/RimL family protein N-acetyltransferase